MNVGSPLYGVHFGFPSGVPPIDPTTVPDVLRVMYYSYPWPQTLLGVYPYTANPCSPGDSVVVVSDRFATTIGGPLQYDRVFNGVSGGPTFQDFGLQFDTGGIDTLSIYNDVVQAGLSVFTMYLWGTLVDSAVWIPFGNVTGTAVIFANANTINGISLADDEGTEADTGGESSISIGKALLRVSVDGSGNWSVIGTGSAENTGNNAFTTFTFNQVGVSGGNVINNGDIGNRHMGQIIVNRVIALGSPEDLGIRAGISAGTYTGHSGYAL